MTCLSGVSHPGKRRQRLLALQEAAQAALLPVPSTWHATIISHLPGPAS